MAVSRREFLKRGAAAGLVAATPLPRALDAPAVRRSAAAAPVVIASMNGNWYKNGGTVTCVEKAFTPDDRRRRRARRADRGSEHRRARP